MTATGSTSTGSRPFASYPPMIDPVVGGLWLSLGMPYHIVARAAAEASGATAMWCSLHHSL